MAKRRVQLMVVWMAVAACAFAIGHTLSASADQQPESPAATTPTSMDSSRAAEESAGLEMEALQSHARTRMILYPGRFEQADHAQLRRELDAVALMLKSVRGSNATGR